MSPPLITIEPSARGQSNLISSSATACILSQIINLLYSLDVQNHLIDIPAELYQQLLADLGRLVADQQIIDSHARQRLAELVALNEQR